MQDYTNHIRHCSRCSPETGQDIELKWYYLENPKFRHLRTFNWCDDCLQQYEYKWGVPMEYLDKLRQAIKIESSLISYLDDELKEKAYKHAKDRIRTITEAMVGCKEEFEKFEVWLNSYRENYINNLNK